MTTITKCIDLRIMDHEVDIELDADDLEDFDSDDLWQALSTNHSTDHVAKLVSEDDDVTGAVLDRLEASYIVDNKEEVIEESLTRLNTDQQKEAVASWLAEDSGALKAFTREQLGVAGALDTSEQFVEAFDKLSDVEKRSVLNHAVYSLTVDDVAHAVAHCKAPMRDVLHAFLATYDPQVVLATAFGAALVRLQAVQS